MKIEIEVDDSPHSRHTWATRSGKVVVLVMPLGLDTREEVELADKLIKFGRFLKRPGGHKPGQSGEGFGSR